LEAVFTSELNTYGSYARYRITVRVGNYRTTTGTDTRLAGLIYELMNGAVLKDSANFLYELDGRKADILRKLIALPRDLQQYLAFYIERGKLNIDTLSKHFLQRSGGSRTDGTIKEMVDDVFEIAEYFGKPIPKEERQRLYVKLVISLINQGHK
jgi:hypothetical protein